MIEIVRYPQHYWDVAAVIVDGKKVRTLSKFYEVTETHIVEYETRGSAEHPARGDMVWRMALDGHDFEVRNVRDGESYPWAPDQHQ